MSLVNNIIKNSLALLSSQAFHSFVSLIAVAIIARYLGVERFGDYGFILAICNIFQVMTDMGANQIFIREVARCHEKVHEYFTANIFLMVIFGTLVFCLIVGTVYCFESSRHLMLAAIIGALAVILLFFSQLFSSVFQAFEKMQYVAFMRSLSYVVYLTFVILAVKFDTGIVGIFIALLMQNIFACIVGYEFTRKYFFKPKFVFNKSRVWEVFCEGWPIGINAILRKISYRVDILFLKGFSSLIDLGLFNGIYRIILQLQFIPRNITSALFPVFSRLSKDKENLVEVHSRTIKFLLIGFIPILGILVIFPKEVISIILGKDFIKAVPLMRILSLCLGLLFFSTLFIKTLNATNKQRSATFCVAVCLGVNILFDLLLIPKWGYMGAGIATLAAETLLFGLTGLLVIRYLAIRPLLLTIIKLTLAGLILMVFWVGLCGKITLFKFIIGGILYLLMLWGLHVFDDQECMWFYDQLRKIFRHLARA